MEYLIDDEDYIYIDRSKVRLRPFYRCKDCKHYKKTQYGNCCCLSEKYQPRKSPIEYCSNAERKVDE